MTSLLSPRNIKIEKAKKVERKENYFMIVISVSKAKYRIRERIFSNLVSIYLFFTLRFFSDEIRQCKLRLQYAAVDDVSKYGSRLPINLIIQGTENNKVS